MNTALMPLAFDFEGHAVRTINRDGEPWWVLVDLCAVLELGSPHKAADRLDDDEKGRTIIPTLGGPQEMTVINESGLFSLILTSRKPAAKRFKKWVTAVVLPSLRRTGSFSVEAAILASQNAVKVLTPKAQAYHQLACMDGLHTLTDAAKLCGMPRDRFISTLEAVGWIYRPGGSGRLQGKADKIKAGFLTHKYHETRDHDGHLKERSQVVVTDRGVARLRIVLTRLENAMLGRRRGMIAALFCGGVKTFAILGLLNPPEGLGLNTVERVAFRAAADELMLSTESALYADTHPALHDAASIVNKREFWFWQVGFAKPVMGHAPRRQEICLAAPASMGALWLRQNLNHADLPKLPPDRNGTELDARDLLEGFRGACDHSLYEAEQDFLNGNQDFQVLPIWKDAAEAWKAVRSLGAILLLTTPPPRLEPRVISSGIADHAAA